MVLTTVNAVRQALGLPREVGTKVKVSDVHLCFNNNIFVRKVAMTFR